MSFDQVPYRTIFIATNILMSLQLSKAVNKRTTSTKSTSNAAMYPKSGI